MKHTLEFFKPIEKRPTIGRYVLVKLIKDNWMSDDDTECYLYDVACMDEYNKWSTFGPDSYDDYEIEMWAYLPNVIEVEPIQMTGHIVWEGKRK